MRCEGVERRLITHLMTPSPGIPPIKPTCRALHGRIYQPAQAMNSLASSTQGCLLNKQPNEQGWLLSSMSHAHVAWVGIHGLCKLVLLLPYQHPDSPLHYFHHSLLTHLLHGLFLAHISVIAVLITRPWQCWHSAHTACSRIKSSENPCFIISIFFSFMNGPCSNF